MMEFRIGEAVPGQAKIVSVEDKPGPEGISTPSATTEG
jgi:hypothetical protein